MVLRAMLGEVRRIGLREFTAAMVSIYVRAALFAFIVVAPYRFVSGAPVVHLSTARVVLVVAVIGTVVVTVATLYGSATGASWYTRAEAQRVQMEGAKEAED